MESVQWKVLAQSSLQDYKIQLSTRDMSRYKIGAMEPIVVNQIAILHAWPSANQAENTVGVSLLQLENLQNEGSRSEFSIERLKIPLFQVHSVVVKPCNEVTDVSNVLLMMVKDYLMQLKYVQKAQKIKLKMLDEYIELELSVKADENGLPILPLSIDGSLDQTTSQPISQNVFVMHQAALIVKSQPLNTCLDAESQLGGLSQQLKIVRDAIELPLLHPDVYKIYGMEPTKGILLYGPPGTGKTLLVRTVALQIGCSLISVSAGDISSKYQGDTESQLKSIFKDAQSQSPAILFIDEVDSLCPKRDESVGETEKRVVSTLLTLMDGTEDIKPQSINSDVKVPHVVVVGATNRPHAIDPALRRNGRFDKEIEIGIPSSQDRHEILNLYLKKMPHVLSESQIFQISETTHGYVGADLAGLCREASMFAMSRHLESTEVIDSSSILPVEHKVSLYDFIQAKNMVKPSAMREISLEIPHVRWSDIGGLNDVKQKLQQSIEWPLRHPEAFRTLGIDPPKGVLLYGPPGCSKTLMAKAIATESKLNFFAIKGPELYSKWVGESERAVKEIFRKARAASPSIIFFDEIDAVASSRSGMGSKSNSSSSSVGDRVLIQLLTELDGVESLVNVTVIAATNRPDILDPALMRPGRLDRLLYIPPPDEEARKAIFNLRTVKMPLADNVSLDELAKESAGRSGAEIVAIAQEAALSALQRMQSCGVYDVDALKVSREDFLAALQAVKPRITKQQLQYYEDFASNKK